MASSENEVGRKSILDGARNWDYWLTLAWLDVRGRYRRTLIGPFWSSLNGLLFVLILSLVYSSLLREKLSEFIPYVASGYFIWTFFTATVSESCSAFYSHAEVLKTSAISPFAMLCRVVVRNLLVFAHHSVVIVIVMVVFGKSLVLAPLALIGLFFIALFLIGVGVPLAFICCRYRDVEQLVQSILMTLFFATPILWQPSSLDGKGAIIVEWNVFYHILRLARDPLLGVVPPFASYFIAACATMLSLVLGYKVYVSWRSRLGFWL